MTGCRSKSEPRASSAAPETFEFSGEFEEETAGRRARRSPCKEWFGQRDGPSVILKGTGGAFVIIAGRWKYR
jgi:hypothetical protein